MLLLAYFGLWCISFPDFFLFVFPKQRHLQLLLQTSESCVPATASGRWLHTASTSDGMLEFCGENALNRLQHLRLFR